MDQNKTVFVFAPGYLPGKRYGGPVSSIVNFTNLLGDLYDIRIITTNHDLGANQQYQGISRGWNNVGKAKVVYLEEDEFKVNRFIEIMSDFNVVMVYLSGFFYHAMNYPAITASKMQRLHLVIAARGELCRNAIAIKSWKKIPYLILMKAIGLYKDVVFQSTSPEETLALRRCFKNADIVELDNVPAETKKLLQSKKITGEVNLLFISRIHPKKNLKEAIEGARLAKGKVHLDIYGPIEDVAYWDECKLAIGGVPRNISIRYIGALTPEEATAIYCKYDYFILPTVSENYGHAIAEALRSNVPVIIPRDVTPWNNVNEVAGFTYKLHDLGELSSILNKCCEQTTAEHQSIINSVSEYAKTTFNVKQLYTQYAGLIEGL